jgi:serine/threonine protein kinase/tetratricopeptide (TPR) repeat protein
MNPDDWRKVEELFDRATRLPRAERTAFVAREAEGHTAIAREVESLLAHDDTEGDPGADPGPPPTVVGQALGAAAAALVEEIDTPTSQRLGPYRLIEPLGDGGMGTVWLAERDDLYRQRVAIKLSRGGAFSRADLERFGRERQILAQLEHPNIARLIDGGTTPDGVPYLVMELVEGRPLDEFARDRALDLTQRLLLFLAICEAVQHAHRRLIVHRDLKPSNILVTGDGTPKLLDFGIAKLLADEGETSAPRTALNQRFFTADYASPEQVAGDVITTASDVYSLGIVLEELLTGKRPKRSSTKSLKRETASNFERRRGGEVTGAGSGADVAIAIADTEPVHTVERRKPTARIVVGRDLETILARAHAHEVERRYGSVEAFADDLRRYLSGLPVKARPDTLGYRLTKFAGRHRVGVGLSFVALAALTAFVVTLTRQNARVIRERDRAVEAEREAQNVSEFLTQMFREADPRRSNGREITARELLVQGSGDIAAQEDVPPRVRIALLRTMAIAFRGLGDPKRAAELYRQAVDLHGPLTADNEVSAARALEGLGDCLREAGDYAGAEPLIRQALEIRRRRLAADDLDLAESLNDLGLLFTQVDRDADAISLLDEAIAIRRQHTADAPAVLAVSLSNRGQLAMEEGKFDDAVRWHQEALDIRRRLFGEDNAYTINSVFALARTLERSGDVVGALEFMQRALTVRERIFGPNHPDTTQTRNSLASLLHDAGRLDEAERLYRQNLAARITSLGENHAETAVSLNNLASLEEDRGRFAEAAALLERSLGIRIQAFGESSSSVARVRHNLGRVRASRGDVAGGLALIAQATAWRREHLKAPSSEVGGALVQWGRIERRSGRLADGLRKLEEGLAMQRAALGDRHPSAAESRAETAAARGDRGCETEARAGLEVLVAAGPQVAPAAARARLHLGDCLAALGRREEAQAAWRESLAVLEPRFGAGNLWVRELHRRLARSPAAGPS